MSGYYCRDCDAIKPLFVVWSTASGPAWRSPVSGPFRSIPSWPVTAIWGFRFPDTPKHPLASALEHVAQRLLDSLDRETR